MGGDAGQAAEVLIAWFLPLCYQRLIRMPLPQAVVVHLLGDLALFVVHFINVAGAPVRYAKHGPHRLRLALALVGSRLHCRIKGSGSIVGK